ncbi:hypothetical protein TNIN_133181 [Trichonephila inaurata madagascariensis]|uniref:Uncharacterized protein n=1 Tax=Trichonephila inaurata madagascariensis TaxID=2747483 RepID=A0A8X6X3Q3_9ARAC|nr:hypothetical protein TNIN_133181 [Trichonephila inaurata madagascariensis]
MVTRTLEPEQMEDMADRIMKVPLLTSMPSVNSIDPIVASASHSFGDIRIASGEGESTPYDHILKEYPTLTRPSGTLRDVSHSTVHHIRTLGSSVFCRTRCLDPE